MWRVWVAAPDHVPPIGLSRRASGPLHIGNRRRNRERMSTKIAESPAAEPTPPSAGRGGEPTTAATGAGAAVGRGLASAALVITVGNLLSRILGLGREALAASYFGTDAVKPFAFADSMLTILYDLLISGMVASALVPVLSEFAGAERREELRRIVGTLLTLALIVIGGVTIVLEIFAPGLVHLWLASGSGTLDAELIPAAIDNVRLILPAVTLLGFSAILTATNYALGSFAWPSVSQAVRNGAIIVATVVLAGSLGVSSMVVGVLAGGVLLIALQLPGLRGALPRPSLDLRHPAIRRILRLYAPISLGLVAATLGQVIDRRLAWGAGVDVLGAMRYATALQQLVLGLLAAGIALGALPALARQAEAGDEAGFRATLATALRLTTVLIVPATIGLLALAGPLAALVFGHGATDEAGVDLIALALVWYVPGTFFQAYDQILINAFYARKNTLTPQLVGVAAVALYIGLELALVGRFGMVALVGAISVQWTFHALVMFYLGRHMLVGDDRRAFGRVAAICLAVGVPMGLLAFGASAAIGRLDAGPSLLREGAAVLLPAALGAAFYAWGVTRLGVGEFAAVARALLGRLGLAAGGVRTGLR